MPPLHYAALITPLHATATPLIFATTPAIFDYCFHAPFPPMFSDAAYADISFCFRYTEDIFRHI